MGYIVSCEPALIPVNAHPVNAKHTNLGRSHHFSQFGCFGMAYPLQEQLVTSQLKSELHANKVDQRAVNELQQVIDDLKTDKTLLQANNEKLIKS